MPDRQPEKRAIVVEDYDVLAHAVRIATLVRRGGLSIRGF